MKENYFAKADAGCTFVLELIEKGIIAALKFVAGVLLFPFWLIGRFAPVDAEGDGESVESISNAEVWEAILRERDSVDSRQPQRQTPPGMPRNARRCAPKRPPLPHLKLPGYTLQQRHLAAVLIVVLIG